MLNKLARLNSQELNTEEGGPEVDFHFLMRRQMRDFVDFHSQSWWTHKSMRKSHTKCH